MPEDSVAMKDRIILVVGDNRKYTCSSTRIFHMMLDYTPLVEVFSIDKAFLDVTHSLKIFGSPERLFALRPSDSSQPLFIILYEQITTGT